MIGRAALLALILVELLLTLWVLWASHPVYFDRVTP